MQLENTLRFIKKFIPSSLFKLAQPIYHWILAFLGTVLYAMPSSNITVIGITGTKGKSSVIEMANAVFEEAGYKTALVSTIRLKIGSSSEPNKKKMSLPGRFFVQRFLRRAVKEKCDVVFLELTSEGVLLHRHRFLSLDALIFTGLHKEHIEAHGSFENYAKAKLEIGRALVVSSKQPRSIIANADSPYAKDFLALPVEHSIPFSLTEVEPYSVHDNSVVFTFEDIDMHVSLPGIFTINNALATAKLARVFDIPVQTIRRGLKNIRRIPGRVEKIDEGQSFDVVVDYAHTPDSLRAVYEAYKNRRKICVLGSAGGERDTWKRPEMARIAEEYCEYVILTNEDPYDENPRKIVEEMAGGMKTQPDIIMDRRLAIAKALSVAQSKDTVLLTGKGTDPYIMGPNGKKESWNDAKEVRTALRALVDGQIKRV